MSIQLLTHQMIQLMAMIALGFVLCKAGLADQAFNKKMTGIINNCTMPFTILAAVFSQPAGRHMDRFLTVTVISLVFYALMPLVSFLIIKCFCFIPRGRQGIYMFLMTYSNIGFMGIPVVQALFGNTGVLYAAVLNIAFNVSSFTAGVFLINYGSDDGGGTVNLKRLFSPCVITSVAALVIYCLGITMPDDVVAVCDSVGAVTSPMAMILLGATLASMKPREVFGDPKVYPFALFRQIVVPVILILILKIVVSDPMMYNVLAVLLLMPAANLSVLLSYQYNRDVKLASKIVFITTLMSMVTIPVIMSLV